MYALFPLFCRRHYHSLTILVTNSTDYAFSSQVYLYIYAGCRFPQRREPNPFQTISIHARLHLQIRPTWHESGLLGPPNLGFFPLVHRPDVVHATGWLTDWMAGTWPFLRFQRPLHRGKSSKACRILGSPNGDGYFLACAQQGTYKWERFVRFHHQQQDIFNKLSELPERVWKPERYLPLLPYASHEESASVLTAAITVSP